MKLSPSIALILLNALLLSACSDSEMTESTQSDPTTDHTIKNPPMAVSVSSLHQEHGYDVSHRFIGLVTAKQQANLGFERSGKITRILVQVGDKVQQGQTLIELDTDMLQSRQKQIQAQQNKIKAELALAKKKLDRQNYLKTKGFSADANIDELTSQIAVLTANTNELNETLRSNLLEQEKSILIAPYSGVVSTRFISLGDIVNVGTPTLTLLSNEKPELHIGIPTKYVAQLTAKGQFEAEIDNRIYPIQRIDSGTQVDNQSRTVTLRFALPENESWINGQLAYLNFQEPRKENGFWVPLSSLTNGMRGTWNIYVITDQDDQLTTERRSVELIYANSHYAYIRGAISNNDEFVTKGLHRIVPGQQVTIVSDPMHFKTATLTPKAVESRSANAPDDYAQTAPKTLEASK
ncbi:efflux RND transporter periplasmic adaptor subunit [Vibrio rumoiensis]|uniref:Multidrug resistance protein MdtA-like barrel-sandwich hybrid domain-containing protein n=1 Tax=Vibrio rumoiensis 1S-45 TaxID=1188252 RepID=A0A1E5E3K9_9VIBR|nr:efflux RND transporter periplasmic adaptor subunit [Vibrio rumoiensis]OEF26822.1 hypothetical protein A1QC_15235 [Vibrio rumoiensis 1S-45]